MDYPSYSFIQRIYHTLCFWGIELYDNLARGALITDYSHFCIA